jgi:RNase P/RNase MRP subunit POP5
MIIFLRISDPVFTKLSLVNVIWQAIEKINGSFTYNKLPIIIKIPDIEKINGHNLYGRKFTL